MPRAKNPTEEQRKAEAVRTLAYSRSPKGKAAQAAYRKSKEGKAVKAAWYAKTINAQRAKVDAIKEASPCMDCDNFFPAICMDFDHVRGEKKSEIAKLVRKVKWERVLEEIEKCDIVCACCHRLRTESRRPASESPTRYIKDLDV